MTFTRTRGARAATVGAVSLAMLLGGGGAAVAATEDDDATQAVADLIAQVAPDQGDVVEGELSPDGVTAEVGALAVTIPFDADAPVVLDAGRSPLEVTLPTEVAADASEVADDGTIVYEGDEATAAAQVLQDGSVRLQTVTESADGPHEFTYTFGENVVPVEKADGTGVELVEEHDGFAITVGEVAPAWAVDANGDEVATSYEIQGNALVQVIEASADATYPVVADPKVTNAWWNTTIYFSKSETGSLAAGAGGAAAVAALIPDPTVSKIIAVAAGVASAYIGVVQSSGKCIKAVLYAHIAPVVWQPYSGKEAGGYCR